MSSRHVTRSCWVTFTELHPKANMAATSAAASNNIQSQKPSSRNLQAWGAPVRFDNFPGEATPIFFTTWPRNSSSQRQTWMLRGRKKRRDLNFISFLTLRFLFLEDEFQERTLFRLLSHLARHDLGSRNRIGKMYVRFEDLRIYCGNYVPNFETLDAKIANASKKVLVASDFIKKVLIEDQKAQNETRFLRGRQIAFMIYDYFGVTGTGESIFELPDLMNVSLRGVNVQEFNMEWSEVLLSMEKTPRTTLISND